jgi:MFS transporter, UMF1 family
MGLLGRLALDRKPTRAWVMYDWANSAFVTVVVTALFAPWFSALYTGPEPTESAKASATGALAITTTIALVLIAVASPLLGAIADRTPIKKRMLAFFTAMGALATVGFWFVGPEDWFLALILFAIGNVAANGAFVFYDALLPHVARPDELDRVSTAGYALGYVGGGVLLTVNVAMLLSPATFSLADKGEAVRAAFVMTAIWWVVFAIPLFRHVPEPHLPEAQRVRGSAAIRAGVDDLRHTWRELKRYPQAALLLLAFLIYNDGVGTIIRMAVAYGTEIGFKDTDLIIAILIVQFVGIPATFAFGQLAGRMGTRRAIFLGIAAYCVVSVLGYFMTSPVHFYVLAGMVGLVQGGVQALSRSLFASMIPKHKSSEFFGLFAVFEKFAGIIGPALFALTNTAFGSSRPAILGVITFFVVGGVLLARVDVAAGQRAVADANAGPLEHDLSPARVVERDP